MSERYTIIRLKTNPVRVRKKRAKRHSRRVAKRRRGHRPVAARHRYAVEVLHQTGQNVHFYFWDGKTLNRNRSAAQTFATSGEAMKVARECMRNRSSAYKLARVVPA